MALLDWLEVLSVYSIFRIIKKGAPYVARTQQSHYPAYHRRDNWMNIVINKVRIRGPVEAIFDLATTARYWPAWHPSTISVGGVTERPYQLGDTIHHVAHIADKTRDGTWTVTEHVRPQRVALQMHGGLIEVRYTFVPLKESTRVIRRLTYPADFVGNQRDLQTFEQTMHAESELGLQQLKAVVEDILRCESEPQANKG